MPETPNLSNNTHNYTRCFRGVRDANGFIFRTHEISRCHEHAVTSVGVARCQSASAVISILLISSKRRLGHAAIDHDCLACDKGSSRGGEPRDVLAKVVGAVDPANPRGGGRVEWRAVEWRGMGWREMRWGGVELAWRWRGVVWGGAGWSLVDLGWRWGWDGMGLAWLGVGWGGVGWGWLGMAVGWCGMGSSWRRVA